ncbi:MAG: prepilin-type N-terminal cleavage/methylation domain-containing protein [Candidatus Saccharibacteria bacterium]|nr:prepilin-type N-terminal cleavage/methylation domain-containing protein [Candidatus Saccharibacteria bacterium]
MDTNKRMDNRQKNKISLLFQSKSKIGNPKSKIGLTLIEIMVAILIISVAVIGAMGFRFYCITDAKKADVQANAARIGSMMLETWKGLGGGTDSTMITKFKNALVNLSSQYSIDNKEKTPGPAVPSGFIALTNNYEVKDLANQVYYYAALSYKKSSTEPNAMNASIMWRQKYGNDKNDATAHTLSMTTYQD